MANVSSWLPGLLGPVDFQVDGVDTSVPRRGTINLVGATVTDDSDNDRTDIALVGVIGVESSYAGADEQYQTERQVNVRTPSNTPATLTSYNTTDQRAYVVKGYVVAQSADLAEYAFWDINALLTHDGTLAMVTAAPVTEQENNTGTPDLAFDVSEGIALVFTGVSAVPMRATGRILIHEIISVPDL